MSGSPFPTKVSVENWTAHRPAQQTGLARTHCWLAYHDRRIRLYATVLFDGRLRYMVAA
jgi:hypothetical protein